MSLAVGLWCFFCLVLVVSSAPPCRFAPSYDTQQLLSSEAARQSYAEAVAYWEGMFHQPGVGYNGANGVTFDGHGLDATTGGIADPLHDFSAPSKESMHVGMLALALSGNRIAQIFISPANVSAALPTALKLLSLKMDAYEAWNRTYPGFGGFLPWFSNKLNVKELQILSGWTDRVPSLDNGEWAWALFATSVALKNCGSECGKTGADLWARYQNYFSYLARNSVLIFYDGSGNVRAEAKILNIRAPPTRGNYQNNVPGYFLDDPYEGEMFVWLADLYGIWPTPQDRDMVWQNKKAKIQPAIYVSSQNPNIRITVQKGFWFSAHEQWKYLELPYLDTEIHLRLYRNCERARAQYSADNVTPGMYASVSNWTLGGPVAEYVSAVGIPEIAFQPSATRDLLTPYGTMNLVLIEPKYGIAWHHVSVMAPRMQGPHGTTESMSKNGEYISPVVTWDSKITTLVAMAGGFHGLTKQGLQEDGTLARFLRIAESEWKAIFPTLEGEDISFAPPPPPAIPPGVADFTRCKVQ